MFRFSFKLLSWFVREVFMIGFLFWLELKVKYWLNWLLYDDLKFLELYGLLFIVYVLWMLDFGRSIFLIMWLKIIRWWRFLFGICYFSMGYFVIILLENELGVWEVLIFLNCVRFCLIFLLLKLFFFLIKFLYFCWLKELKL